MRVLPWLTLAACSSFGVAPGDGAVADAGATNSDGGAVDAAAPTGYAAVVLADGPIAYWRLDETSGIVAKDQIGTHDGVYSGGCVLGVTGATRGNGALSLPNDQKCQVDVGKGFAFAGNAPFSVEAWVENAPDNSQCCFHVFTHEERNGAPTAGYALLVESPTTIFAERVGGNSVPQVSIPGSQFVHVVLTYDGANMTIYANGVFGQTERNTGANASDSIDAFIGSSGSGNYFTGAIDEVAIYDHALTAAAIKTHYQAANL